MKKLMETSLPENYSRGLTDERGFTVAAMHADKIATLLFTGVSTCLKDAKSQEFPVAFAFEELNGDIIVAAIVQYYENEDAAQPGNWSYVWTFDKTDIPEGAKVIKMADQITHPIFIAIAGKKFGMGFENNAYLVDLLTYFTKQLSKWLQDNAKEGEEVGIELDGIFQARAAVEDGEVVKSIEVIGETNAIVKSDKNIEV